MNPSIIKGVIVLLVLMCSYAPSYAQEINQEESNNPKNEISTNLMDLVIAGTLNFNYERHFKNNQSLWFSVNLFDTYGYYDAGYIEDNNAFSFQGAYMIYFSSKNDHTGFFFYPLVKFRFGDVTVEDGINYFDGEDFENFNYSYEIDGFGLGFGLGYKWLFSNRFSLMLNGQIARNLSDFDDDYLSSVEPRFGVNFGYRF